MSTQLLVLIHTFLLTYSKIAKHILSPYSEPCFILGASVFWLINPNKYPNRWLLLSILFYKWGFCSVKNGNKLWSPWLNQGSIQQNLHKRISPGYWKFWESYNFGVSCQVHWAPKPIVQTGLLVCHVLLLVPLTDQRVWTVQICCDLLWGDSLAEHDASFLFVWFSSSYCSVLFPNAQEAPKKERAAVKLISKS